MYKIIATGSSGNCMIFKGYIMIDCGVSFIKIKDYVQDIKYLFLTHIHGDHFKPNTILRLVKENPKVKVITPNYLEEEVSKVVPKRNIRLITPGKGYRLDELLFQTSPTDHNVPNVCYKININGIRVLYATDMNNLDNVSAKGYDYLFVECNHDSDYIFEKIQEAQANGEYTHFQDSINNHFSKQKYDAFIAENKYKGAVVVPMHKSEHGFRDEEL